MSLDSYTHLPPVLNRISEVAGLGAALQLAKERGGGEVYVPEKIPGSKLAGIVGVEQATKIRDEFGVGGLRIPFGPVGGGAKARRERVCRAIENGKSVLEAARQNDVHMRTARRVKAKMRKPRTTDLFE